MTRKQVIILIVIILCVLALGLLMLRQANSPKNQEIKQITYTTQTINENAGKFTVSVQYPQVNIPDYPKTQEHINGSLEKLAQKTISDFKVADEKLRAPELSSVSTLNVEYEAKSIGQVYFGVRFIAEAMSVGAAHPNNYQFTYNYDVINDREVKLVDLFKPSVDYLKNISSFVKANTLKRKSELTTDDEWINKGTAPKPENYQSWLLDRNALVIFLDYYQVAPRPASYVEIDMPYRQLKGLFKVDGLIGEILSD